MAKRKIRKLTPEEIAESEELSRLVRARIAERLALEREWEAQRAQPGLVNRIKRSLRAARAAW